MEPQVSGASKTICRTQSMQGLPIEKSLYLWKRWPQGSLRAVNMVSQQMAQSSSLAASSSAVATANLYRYSSQYIQMMMKQLMNDGIYKAFITNCVVICLRQPVKSQFGQTLICSEYMDGIKYKKV